LQFAQVTEPDAGSRRALRQRGPLVEQPLCGCGGIGHAKPFCILGELHFLGEPGQGFVQRLKVRQHQFRGNDLHIACRGHITIDVAHVRVIEHAHHLADRVGLPDVREELVTQALPLRRAPHQPRDVHETHGGRDDLR
jgi:hypothetical protein